MTKKVEETTSVQIFYGVSDDFTLLSLTLVEAGKPTSTWAFNDAQIEHHIGQLRKYQKVIEKIKLN